MSLAELGSGIVELGRPGYNNLVLTNSQVFLPGSKDKSRGGGLLRRSYQIC